MANIVKIERKGETGFETKELSINEALPLLNNDIQNEMTVWIDNRPFSGDVLTADDLQKCKKEVSVTNRLVGG